MYIMCAIQFAKFNTLFGPKYRVPTRFQKSKCFSQEAAWQYTVGDTQLGADTVVGDDRHQLKQFKASSI